MLLNNQNLVSNRENTKIDSSILKKIILHPSTATLSNVKPKRVSKVYHLLYNDSVGKNYV